MTRAVRLRKVPEEAVIRRLSSRGAPHRYGSSCPPAQARLGVESRKLIDDCDGVPVAMRLDVASRLFESVITQRNGTNA